MPGVTTTKVGKPRPCFVLSSQTENTQDKHEAHDCRRMYRGFGYEGEKWESRIRATENNGL